jgi:hypothetical protein
MKITLKTQSLKNTISNTFKTLTLSGQQNLGTTYQPKLRNPVVYVRLRLV